MSHPSTIGSLYGCVKNHEVSVCPDSRKQRESRELGKSGNGEEKRIQGSGFRFLRVVMIDEVWLRRVLLPAHLGTLTGVPALEARHSGTSSIYKRSLIGFVLIAYILFMSAFPCQTSQPANLQKHNEYNGSATSQLDFGVYRSESVSHASFIT